MSWFHGATIQNPMLNGSGPGFTRYTRNEFDKLRRQHNIMVLVGNGFDIQVLQDYNRHVDSRYETFYHYLKMRGFDPANVLVQHMETELELHQHTGGHRDWSDVEAALASTLASGAHAVDALLTDLRAIQAAFAQFLQMVAPSELLEQLGADAAECKWSHTSLAEFLADVTDRNAYLTMQFPKRVDHYDLFNFQFMNFNYTTLLDDSSTWIRSSSTHSGTQPLTPISSSRTTPKGICAQVATLTTATPPTCSPTSFTLTAS